MNCIRAPEPWNIGLFGDRLFNRDVLRELDAGNGIFWKIKTERETCP